MDCPQVLRVGLDIHDFARHLLEMVNVLEAMRIAHLLPQALLTALNP